MLTPNGPKVLEYNARFGDPETQAILPLMKSKLTDAFFACIDGSLDRCDIAFSEDACVCIVAASGGYPQSYQKGFPISGIHACEKTGATVFHAGTDKKDNGFVTNGGRVLGVVQCGKTLPEAIEKAYRAMDEICFEGKHVRRISA